MFTQIEKLKIAYYREIVLQLAHETDSNRDFAEALFDLFVTPDRSPTIAESLDMNFRIVQEIRGMAPANNLNKRIEWVNEHFSDTPKDYWSWDRGLQEMILTMPDQPEGWEPTPENVARKPTYRSPRKEKITFEQDYGITDVEETDGAVGFSVDLAKIKSAAIGNLPWLEYITSTPKGWGYLSDMYRREFDARLEAAKLANPQHYNSQSEAEWEMYADERQQDVNEITAYIQNNWDELSSPADEAQLHNRIVQDLRGIDMRSNQGQAGSAIDSILVTKVDSTNTNDRTYEVDKTFVLFNTDNDPYPDYIAYFSGDVTLTASIIQNIDDYLI